MHQFFLDFPRENGYAGAVMPDASFEILTNVRPHPNADKLELADVLGWQVVIQKGSFKEGATVVYIRPDACIGPYCHWADEDHVNIRRYLGTGGRVKIVQLRGEFSNGIVLDPIKVWEELRSLKLVTGKLWTPQQDLGVTHYTPPPPRDLQVLRSCLPTKLGMSDEVNWQELLKTDPHFGSRALCTKKMDGQSAALYCNPVTGELAFCSRRQVMKPESDNPYTIALRPYVEQVQWLASYYKEPVALRGEITGKGINAGKCNKDAQGAPTFHLYAVHFPESQDANIRMGRWGSGRHFHDINTLLRSRGIAPVLEVPLVEVPDSDGGVSVTPVLTRELFNWAINRPASEGEGLVFNGVDFSMKAKSAEYYAKN